MTAIVGPFAELTQQSKMRRQTIVDLHAAITQGLRSVLRLELEIDRESTAIERKSRLTRRRLCREDGSSAVFKSTRKRGDQWGELCVGCG
jgi:hypothetical protein